MSSQLKGDWPPTGRPRSKSPSLSDDEDEPPLLQRKTFLHFERDVKKRNARSLSPSVMRKAWASKRRERLGLEKCPERQVVNYAMPETKREIKEVLIGDDDSSKSTSASGTAPPPVESTPPFGPSTPPLPLVSPMQTGPELQALPPAAVPAAPYSMAYARGLAGAPPLVPACGPQGYPGFWVPWEAVAQQPQLQPPAPAPRPKAGPEVRALAEHIAERMWDKKMRGWNLVNDVYLEVWSELVGGKPTRSSRRAVDKFRTILEAAPDLFELNYAQIDGTEGQAQAERMVKLTQSVLDRQAKR